jgi:integrase
MKAATRNRWGHRDATMILVAYRHGLRASEVVDLRWDQIEFKAANLHVRRVKQGTPSTHPILGDELRALRRLQREQESKSPFVFTSERGAPFSPAGFARMIERVGAAAKLGFKAHPHMLRHACGYKLANDGHDTRALQAYLGHKNIQHTGPLHRTGANAVQGFLAQVIAAGWVGLARAHLTVFALTACLRTMRRYAERQSPMADHELTHS